MKLLLTALGAATAVSAHGWVDNATINGQFYDVTRPPLPPHPPNL